MNRTVERLSETELVQTNDAMVWAEQFVDRFRDRLGDIDEGLMFGWFANAMAAQELADTTKKAEDR